MRPQVKVFRSNTLMILIPGIFFSAALLLRSKENLEILIWVLLAIGTLTTIAVVLSFTTVTITEQEIRIKNLKKSQLINVKDIARKSSSTSTSKGIETNVWKLRLKGGEVVTISSDLFKDSKGLKDSLNLFLKNIPNT